jgi:hypothetical protein
MVRFDMKPGIMVHMYVRARQYCAGWYSAMIFRQLLIYNLNPGEQRQIIY